MIIRISKGAHLDHPKVQYLRAREVTLTGEGPLTIETDGELSEHEVAHFRLIAKGLKIIAPMS
jgi:diacylglycerol kinase family enzyme